MKRYPCDSTYSQRDRSDILDELAPGAGGSARIKALASVSTPNIGLLAEPRYLQVTRALPPTLVANAVAVQEANREYQERALGRMGLRRQDHRHRQRHRHGRIDQSP